MTDDRLPPGPVAAEVGPDDAVVMIASAWSEFVHPDTGKMMKMVEVDSPTLEQMTKDRTLEVVERSIIDAPEDGPCLFIRLPEFQILIPLDGAPLGWRAKAEAEGYAITFPPDPVLPFRVWFSLTAERPVLTAGRNEKCPCGSGVKFKKCHGVG